MAETIIGLVLIILQILSYIGNMTNGGLIFFPTFSLYEVVYFLSYNLIGIIGLVLLIRGIRSISKQKAESEQKQKWFMKIYSLILIQRKSLFISTIVSTALMFVSAYLYEEYIGESVLESIANVSLILAIVFCSLSLIAIPNTVISWYKRKKH